jgi:tRNA threonylcarbamoyladenosine biosynthesis protein TsaB
MPLHPPLLAIDTSGPIARAALLARDGQVLAAEERGGPRHSATLLPLCHDLLSARSLKVSDLTAVACGRGPGSFTGLRVGLAVAKGFALAHDLPLLLVSSLQALALDLQAEASAALLAPCIDAGKGELYGQLYRPAGDPPGLDPVTTELRLLPDGFADLVRTEAGGARTVIAGTGADRHSARLSQGPANVQVLLRFPGPSAVSVGRLALPRIIQGERDDLDAATPSYGRPPDITTPKA